MKMIIFTVYVSDNVHVKLSSFIDRIIHSVNNRLTGSVLFSLLPFLLLSFHLVSLCFPLAKIDLIWGFKATLSFNKKISILQYCPSNNPTLMLFTPRIHFYPLTDRHDVLVFLMNCDWEFLLQTTRI